VNRQVFLDGCFVGCLACVIAPILDGQSGTLDGLMQLAFQNILGRQDGQILGDMDAGAAQLKQFDLFAVLPGAKDDAQG